MKNEYLDAQIAIMEKKVGELQSYLNKTEVLESERDLVIRRIQAIQQHLRQLVLTINTGGI